MSTALGAAQAVRPAARRRSREPGRRAAADGGSGARQQAQLREARSRSVGGRPTPPPARGRGVALAHAAGLQPRARARARAPHARVELARVELADARRRHPPAGQRVGHLRADRDAVEVGDDAVAVVADREAPAAAADELAQRRRGRRGSTTAANCTPGWRARTRSSASSSRARSARRASRRRRARPARAPTARRR